MIERIKRLLKVSAMAFLSGLSFHLLSCSNGAAMDDDMATPPDTTTVEPPDTIAGIVCHPDTIYFELEVLPILKSSCGRRDCHDAGEAWVGVILENYESVMATGGIVPFMPEESKIFKKMTNPDEEERMPPLPYDRLAERQVQLIADWINQGANNFRCDSSTVPCDTTGVSYAADIEPLIEDACKGCHNQYVHEDNIELLTHEDLQTVAMNGKLVGTVTGQFGYPQMPYGSIPLAACHLEKIKSWVAAGAPDN